MKLCKDCLHHRAFQSAMTDTCVAFASIGAEDRVRGVGTMNVYMPCAVARTLEHVCGKNADGFQPRAPTFDIRDYCTRCGARQGPEFSQNCFISDGATCSICNHAWSKPRGPIVKKEYWTDTP